MREKSFPSLETSLVNYWRRNAAPGLSKVEKYLAWSTVTLKMSLMRICYSEFRFIGAKYLRVLAEFT